MLSTAPLPLAQSGNPITQPHPSAQLSPTKGFQSRLRGTESLSLFGQFLDYMTGEVVFDFTMARYRLRCSCIWVLIPIMSTTVANENTAEFLDLADQVSTLHAT